MFHSKLFLCLFVLFLCGQQPVFADLGISVNPLDGSNSLRFGRVLSNLDNAKQVRVRVSATDGKQYQIFQRVLEPIINEKGDVLDLKAMTTVTQANSNASGTLYLQNTDSLSFGDQLLYTSGRGGESDSFIVAYSVDPGVIKASGSFTGRLLLTVRELGGSSQDQASINVFLDNPSNWNASIAGGHTPERVRVKDSDTSEKTADFVKVAFSGNSGQEVRVYQEVMSMPQNIGGKEFLPDALLLTVNGQTQQNIRVSGATTLRPGRTLLYSGQEAEDNFVVSYFWDADKVRELDAGTYTGKIRLIVEGNGSAEERLIDLEAQVQPTFSLDASLPSGGVRFTHVLPTNPPEDREVVVTVNSNLQKSYQVLQSFQTPMTNEQGKEIGKDNFLIKVEIPAGQKGRTRFNDFTPVETGDYPIFFSDTEGSAAFFKVVYRLKVSSQASPGNYSAPVKFSLNQN
jgi:hypothetical protein